MDFIRTPYYEGRDPNLKEPYCFACRFYENRIVFSDFIRCSRCHMAWYCSTQCQKKHDKRHRERCNLMMAEWYSVEQSIVPLQDSDVLSDDSAVVQRYFEANDNILSAEVGEYLCDLTSLATVFWHSAYECEIKQVWEAALFHCEKVIKVRAGYNLEARVRIPFILLYLNRDDEAYAYIRYWFEEGIHGRSRPYPIEPNCRYFDIFEENSTADMGNLQLPLFVALAIIKMRIIASHNAISRSIDIAFEQADMKQILEVRSDLQDFLLDCDIDVLDQSLRLNRIFEEIEREEPFLLDSMLKAEQFSEIRDFSFLDEALISALPSLKLVLLHSVRCFFRVPRASDLLWNFIIGNDRFEDVNNDEAA
ncbi:hypothetical protein FisN_10Lu076 [Fistulifera solaris]|uniref:MYND-type domain-containing protein n=1 Tax=Fistulifera solaris TaxID=1519565 RepID=A0A1Z5JTK6_FISSO|nr:hypothetical protein FisN_10Lu076 [Fistulifera solaris]|eukprot:GAX17206.1 hypothetical protein FisN_10Lu076 [Fistulifera solaris]